MTPTLYVKTGCPYCKAAKDFLDAHKVDHTEVDVRGDEAGMENLRALSGQTKTPTLVWDGKILADFGVEELEKFLKDRAA